MQSTSHCKTASKTPGYLGIYFPTTTKTHRFISLQLTIQPRRGFIPPSHKNTLNK
jgi:hypothetical protein